MKSCRLSRIGHALPHPFAHFTLAAHVRAEDEEHRKTHSCFETTLSQNGFGHIQQLAGLADRKAPSCTLAQQACQHYDLGWQRSRSVQACFRPLHSMITCMLARCTCLHLVHSVRSHCVPLTPATLVAPYDCPAGTPARSDEARGVERKRQTAQRVELRRHRAAALRICHPGLALLRTAPQRCLCFLLGCLKL